MSIAGEPMVRVNETARRLRFPFSGLDDSHAGSFSFQNLDPALLEKESRYERINDIGYVEHTDGHTLPSEGPLREDGPVEHMANSNHDLVSSKYLRWQTQLFPQADSLGQESSNGKRQLYSEEPLDTEGSTSRQTKRFRITAESQHGQKGKRAQRDQRERNRIAAAKHRKKKRNALDSLDANMLNASTVNELLRRQSLELRDELARLRMLAIQHTHGEHGCECIAIQWYNLQRVGDIVLTAD